MSQRSGGSDGTHEKSHECDTEEQPPHRLARFGEIIVPDSGSDQFGLAIGVLRCNLSQNKTPCEFPPGSERLTIGAAGLTYFKTVKSFFLRT